MQTTQRRQPVEVKIQATELHLDHGQPLEVVPDGILHRHAHPAMNCTAAWPMLRAERQICTLAADSAASR
jgi:hypothetical protein